jgi:hypothetical protein
MGLEFLGLRAEHQVGKIHIPFMWRNIGAFCHVAKIAEVTLVDDLDVVGFVDPVHLHRFRFIHEVEEGGEGVTQADAAPASVANVVDALQFLFQVFLIPIRV